MPNQSVFATLSAIDITDKLKKKQNLSYLPWSSAWAIIKNHYPDATYRSLKNEVGWNYFTDGKTCWVEVELTIAGETQTEQLAVMDHRNQAIPADTVTSVAVNKSTKRALVKAAALFGLGLSLWNGEELSDEAKAEKKEKAALAAENAKIIELAKQKIDAGVDKDTVYAIVQKYSGGKKNPNAIQSLEDSEACYQEINNLKEEKE